MFEHGEASLTISNEDMIERLGVGIILYFDFLRLSALVFAIMFALALPMMCFCYAGNRINLRDESSAFSKFLAMSTIGNLGTDR